MSTNAGFILSFIYLMSLNWHFNLGCVICIINPQMDYRMQCMTLLYSHTSHHMIKPFYLIFIQDFSILTGGNTTLQRSITDGL